MKLRRSTKLLLTFGTIVGATFGGNKVWTAMQLQSVDLKPIESTDFCLLAINKGAGVKVIVANRIAQVVEASDNFQSDSQGEQGATSSSIKRRIPIKELIQVLDGDPRGVHPFITRLETTSSSEGENEESPLWKAEDVQKALDGDPILSKKLTSELNSELDGSPTQTLNLSTFPDGIRVASPITLNVENLKGKTISAFRISEFKTRSIAEFSNSVKEKYYDKNSVQTLWSSFVKQLSKNPIPLKQSLGAIIKVSSESEAEAKLTRIAQNSKILANRSMVNGVSMFESKIDGQPDTYNLKLQLNDEAKKRLWKYSSEGGKMILVVSKGVAIAAANIGTVLNSNEVVINQIADKRLVDDALETFKK